jgi:hypothetical protein
MSEFDELLAKSVFDAYISKVSKIDCLRFAMCPLLAPVLIGFFFLLQPLTVLMKQTRQAVRAVKQSTLLRCLWFDKLTSMKKFSSNTFDEVKILNKWGCNVRLNGAQCCKTFSVRNLRIFVIS